MERLKNKSALAASLNGHFNLFVPSCFFCLKEGMSYPAHFVGCLEYLMG